MTSNKPSISNVNKISCYRDKAVTMMSIYKLNNEEKFYDWLNRLKFVANIISVPRGKMVKFFFTMVDDDVHKYVQKKDPEVKNRKLPYESIISRYFDILISSKLNIYNVLFLYRNQYEKEPIKYFASYLQKIVKKCGYKQEDRQKRICHQFLQGLREDVLKTYLETFHYESFNQLEEGAIEFAKRNFITYYLDYAYLKIHIYNVDKKNSFANWLNKFEYVADTISVPDNKMVEFFNNMINNDVHLLVKQTFKNDNFSDLSYDMIINVYLRYFYPNEVELHRLRIFCRQQFEHETIENYAKTLKNLFNKCIGSRDLVKKLIKHFINGLREKEVKNHLRPINNKSFDEMVAEAKKFARNNLITYYRDRLLSQINPYNDEKEGVFNDWLNKFEHVADTIDVPKCKMDKLFIEMMDIDINQCVQQTYFSVNFNEFSYKLIVLYYRSYFKYYRKGNFN